MKLMKYTFRTPLSGSIYCEEAFPDTDGHIELTPELMSRLFTKHEELHDFLEEHQEDLTEYVPEELINIILKAEFGDFGSMSGKMYLLTHIWVEESLPLTRIDRIRDWISGQMSDGWGEGLDGEEWMEKRVYKPFLIFDEYTAEFDEDHEYVSARYYVNSWSYENFEVELEEVEEVEEEGIQTMATLSLPDHIRQVIKVSGNFGLKLFLRNSKQEELKRVIEDSCKNCECFVYLVRDKNHGFEVLPKWVVEYDSLFIFYENSLEEGTESTSMPMNEAILKLLK